MNIREFTRPANSKKLNESLAKKFGAKIDVEKFTTEQLQDVRNKIRTALSQTETNEAFDAVQDKGYQKNKLFLDVLNTAIAERNDNIVDAIDEAIQVNEGEEDKAELVMASKDMVDRLTGWMEDTAEMQTESMLELADAIRDEMGAQQSEAFTMAVKPALEQLYASMETTRIALTTGVGMLTGEGEAPPMDMGAEAPVDDVAMEPTDDMDMEADLEVGDEFGAAAPAAGGDDEAGRAKRESRMTKKKMLETSRRLGSILSKPGK